FTAERVEILNSCIALMIMLISRNPIGEEKHFISEYIDMPVRKEWISVFAFLRHPLPRIIYALTPFHCRLEQSVQSARHWNFLISTAQSNRLLSLLIRAVVSIMVVMSGLLLTSRLRVISELK